MESKPCYVAWVVRPAELRSLALDRSAVVKVGQGGCLSLESLEQEVITDLSEFLQEHGIGDSSLLVDVFNPFLLNPLMKFVNQKSGFEEASFCMGNFQADVIKNPDSKDANQKSLSDAGCDNIPLP